ncbi:hypothetical protein [Hyphomonas sp.]|uniref:hypothetical protein n=1 Tax=Hyphomonas sp. TaxID=87 RepID=UPI0025C38BD7|nr:hypothetical protein [Hyphomonas sp.]
MTEKSPSQQGIVIKGNTFKHVGTAALIDGRTDVSYEDNVHIHTQRGLVVSREPIEPDGQVIEGFYKRAAAGWIKPIVITAVGGVIAGLGLIFFGAGSG